MELLRSVAVVYGTPPGIGGLGHSASVGITAVAFGGARTFALGPRVPIPWSLPGGEPAASWLEAPPGLSPWRLCYTWLRWRSGQARLISDRSLGRWAAQR